MADSIVRESHRTVADGFCILAITQYYWGRGKSFSEAIKNLRSQTSVNRKDILFWLCPEGAYVNGMGGINYPNLDDDGNENPHPVHLGIIT